MKLIISQSIIAACLLFALTACSQQGSKKNNTMKENNNSRYTEGKDYLKLTRYRLIDPSGFSEPVEAASFLLPANWKTTGGIQWNMVRCLTDMVQSGVHSVSPDNKYEFFVFPIAQFDWCDNPQILQAMRNGHVGLSCEIAQPLDAAGYISNKLAPLVKATATNTQAIAELDAALKQQAAMNQMPGYSFAPSAAEGTLQFADGSEGLALCIVSQTINTAPDMAFGQGQINTYQTAVNLRVVLRHPKGEGAMARQLLSTILGSTRINPVWANALQTMFNNIKQNIQSEEWKRIQISYQAQQEISNNIVRGWESRNSSSATESGSGDQTQLFGQYLRGVENWTDGDGNKVELTSGYSNAWQHADGSYLLSNTHGFDPNVAFGETWKPLNK